MKFSADSKTLLDVLARARKVCPKAVEVNIVAGKKGAAFLSISSEFSSAKFKIPNLEVEDASEPITVPIDTLVGSIRNRKILNYSTADGQLNFDDGAKYKGHITVPEYTEIELQKPTDGVEIDLSDELASVFNDVVSTATLSGEFGNNTEGMPLYIQLGKAGITALCYDSYYLARATNSSVEFAEQSIAVNNNVLALVTAVAGKNSYKLILTEDSVYAYNSDFMLRHSAIQIDNVDDNIGNIAESISSWLEKESSKITADAAKFKEVLDNMSTFYERGVPIQFVVGKKGVEVRIDGKGGEIVERVEGTTEKPSKEVFRCEFQLLSELLPKVPGPTVEMSFLPDHLMYFNQDDGVSSLFVSAALVSD